ncbi:sensor histidine kinase [Bacillus sp. BRMEA1]|uniref:histidine kinase n=1 Tax=Neobacillus endophyticus TaxID=2738405 RepID=UPI0015650B8E|nr:histidine kinase [Neobacillus endophyticus]NRD78693.1 sensor histidine kinase [Neobacillus endophyticus]
MEYWVIICKLILFAFLAAHYIQHPVFNIPFVMLSFLLYLCLNLLIYLIKHEYVQKVVFLLSIVQIMVSFNWVEPLFILLLPINLCELIASYIQKKWLLFTLILLPLLWLDSIVRFQYGLAAALSFVIHTLAISAEAKLRFQEAQLDEMRKKVHKLTTSLDNNEEFIRQSEYTFKLEERNRLSQVFHDEIGHSMTSALIQMEAAKRLVETDHQKALALLQNAINISKLGIENIRVTLKNLKPPMEQLGIHRLKLMIEEFSTKHQIKTTFVHKGYIDIIKPIQWKIIQENIIEVFTNALKYSKASMISIEVHVLNSLIKVEVRDNGIGAAKVKKGLGMIGMEERTASIDGKIIVDGTNGFSVTMLLPISEHENMKKNI